MTFHLAAPVLLLLLLCLPVLLMRAWVDRQRAAVALEQFKAGAARRAAGEWPRAGRQFQQSLLLLTALTCCVLALSEPRWGTARATGEARTDGQLVLVLDVSRSMGVMDVLGVARADAMRRFLETLLPTLSGWRCGVVLMAGDADVVCPLTSDLEAVKTLLQRARPGEGPGKGTDLEAGIRAALPLFRPGPRHVLLCSDGEVLSGDIEQAARLARDQHAVLLTAVCGTEEGGPVPTEPDMWGNPGFVQYRGETITSRAAPALLANLAEITRGVSVDLAEATAVDDVRRFLGAGAGEAPPSPSVRFAPAEVLEPFQWLLALGTLFLLLEALLELYRRRVKHPSFSSALRLALDRASAIGPGLMVPVLVGGWAWLPSWYLNQQAIEAQRASDVIRSEALLRSALRQDPGSAPLHANLGWLRYQQGDLDHAEKEFQAALSTAAGHQRGTLRYNLGNVHFRQAERGSGRTGYEQAIADYEAALQHWPEDAEARQNLALARQRLKQASPPPASPSPSPSGGRAAAGAAGAVGVNPPYHPPELSQLPTQAEVDSTLKALEQDERRRLAEESGNRAPSRAGELPDPGRLIERALSGFDLERDW
ncbi:MAG: VWA domain-containing protein [Candidatus Sericytochromatia bacterium]|nr:VWA domain-containing protein [Candidatus Sericytochromatia bacterium]